MPTPEIQCPKCTSTQLTANKKGFSGAQAVGGAILTGGIGLLAGTIGSNKINITCLACGHKFKPGEDLISSKKVRRQQQKAMGSPGFLLFFGALILIGYLIIKAFLNSLFI